MQYAIQQHLSVNYCPLVMRNPSSDALHPCHAPESSNLIVCGLLQDSPNVTENMAKVSAERMRLQQLLVHCLDELEASHQLPSLVSSDSKYNLA